MSLLTLLSLMGTAPAGATPEQPSAPSLSPTDLAWSLQASGRIKGFIDPALPNTAITDSAGFAAGTVVNTGAGTLSGAWNATQYELTKSGSGLSFITFPFQTVGAFGCIEIVLNGYAVSGGTYNDLLVGLFAENTTLNCIAAGFPLGSGAGRNYNIVGGAVDSYAAANTFVPEGEIKIYIIYTGRYVTTCVLSGTTETWSNTTEITGTTRLNSASVLDTYKLGLALSSDATTTTVNVKSLKAGYFLGVGFADQHFVNYVNGAPYESGGAAYFIASRKGLPVDGINTADFATLGVYKINLTTLAVSSVGLLFYEQDGYRIGTFSSQVALDEVDGQFHAFFCSWGEAKNYANITDGTVGMRYKKTATNLLSGVHVLTGMSRLPVESGGYTDAAFIRRGGVWTVGYAVNPPTVGEYHYKQKSSADMVSWTPLAEDLTGDKCEGVKVDLIGGTYHLAAGKAGGSIFKYWKLDGTYAGTSPSPITENQPAHPNIRPVSSGGNTYYLLLTMDTQSANYPNATRYTTNGNYYVYKSPTVSGEEY